MKSHEHNRGTQKKFERGSFPTEDQGDVLVRTDKAAIGLPVLKPQRDLR